MFTSGLATCPSPAMYRSPTRKRHVGVVREAMQEACGEMRGGVEEAQPSKSAAYSPRWMLQFD